MAVDQTEDNTKSTSCAQVDINLDISPCLQSMQFFSTGAEKNNWKVDGVWRSVVGTPCLPKHFFQHYAKLTHGLDHVSKGGMIAQMKELWFTKGFTIFAENFFFAKDVLSVIHTMWHGASKRNWYPNQT